MLQPSIQMHLPLTKSDALSLLALVLKNNFVFNVFEQFNCFKQGLPNTFYESAPFDESQNGGEMYGLTWGSMMNDHSLFGRL